MAYTFRYSLLSAPEARRDGSGQVAHSITAISSQDGETWAAIPAHNKTFLVASAELATVMNMPDGTGQERQAKNAAYKMLLCTNCATSTQPLRTDWTTTALQQFMAANDASALEASRANEYVTVTLDQNYPLDFSL